MMFLFVTLTSLEIQFVHVFYRIGPKKPIVRQGHHAESFYFILSGTGK